MPVGCKSKLGSSLHRRSPGRGTVRCHRPADHSANTTDQPCKVAKQLLVTSQMVRNITAPKCSRVPDVGLSGSEFGHVQDNARTRAVSCRPAEGSSERDNRRQLGLRARADTLYTADMRNMRHDNGTSGEQATTDQQEERQKHTRTLQRAKIVQLEADDDVKTLNHLIGEAKVYAIRDRQVEEKRAIQDSVKREECRLDLMMEQQRLRGLEEEKRREIEAQQKKELEKVALIEQIAKNKERRIIEEEKKYHVSSCTSWCQQLPHQHLVS